MDQTAPAETVDGHAEEIGPEPPDQAATSPAMSAELVHRPVGSTQLIDAATPEEKVEQATKIATELDKIVKRQGMRTKMGRAKVVLEDGSEEWRDRFHINVEAWQTLSTFLGLAVVPQPVQVITDPTTGKPEKVAYEVTVDKYARGTTKKAIRDGSAVVESRETYTVEGYSWRARVEVYRDGVLIAAGESTCARTEDAWKRRDDYALQGMAQTRATSRAIAQAARWIVTLAGYSATPSEEMPSHPENAANGENGTQQQHPNGDPFAGDKENVRAAAAKLTGSDGDPLAKVLDWIVADCGGYLPFTVGRAIIALARAATNADGDTPAQEAAADVPADDETAEPPPAQASGFQGGPALEAGTVEQTVANMREYCICEGETANASCPIVGHGIPF